ncbi:uncharacterized protein SCHCODRAFT_02518068, partial [Schizophyllum commune H4-8]|uniref:uncharacterized protein n=1 Tax=Schizophyllum commune (strain H4-8 / FGSC 9210) TaxID=578458 RepID=UPI002160F253
PCQRRINGGRRAGAPTTAASRATADACGAITRGGKPGGRLPHWAQPGDVPGSFRAAVAVRRTHSLHYQMYGRHLSATF